MGRIVTHRNDKSIWLYDYSQFEELSDCADKIVCLSDRDINLIWNAIQNIWTIQSRVYIDADGTQYEVVNDEQWETFIGWVAIMRNNLGAWPVCNDYLSSIAASLEALVNKPCCPSGGTTGSRGSGSSQQPPNPYDQGETPTEPPPGFSSMEEYDGRKCNAAQDLINNLRGDLLGLSGLTYSGSTPTGLAGTLILFFLTPVPFDDIIALAAYLIYSAYSYTFLAQMSAEMGENNADLLCALYTADSASDAETDFLAALEDIALAYFATTDDAEWVMGAIEYMLTYDAFNVLFENIPTTSTDADCSGCADPTGCMSIEFGNLTAGTIDPLSSTFTVESVAGPDVNGEARYWIVMNWEPGCGCIQLGIDSTGYTRGDLGDHFIGNLVYLCSEAPDFVISYTNSPDDWSNECFYSAANSSFQFNSRTAFSIVFTVGDIPCDE